MASRNHQRALALAQRYPAAAEALRFYARICDFSGDIAELQTLVRKHGPAALAQAAREVDLGAATARYLNGEGYGMETFFARVMLRQAPPRDQRFPPQCGILRPEGHGAALTVLCPITQTERPHPRGQCFTCGEARTDQIAFYGSEEMPQLQMQLCESCGSYLHLIDLEKDPEASPEADEIAALPLDAWAVEQGYRKIHPNLIGM
jgi:formate dehydrogenase maturation protein FdhE